MQISTTQTYVFGGCLQADAQRAEALDESALARAASTVMMNDGIEPAMITSIRQDLLNTLAELSATCPEMRFGQLIANLSTLARGLSAEGLWDAEDEDLLAAAREQLASFAERSSAVAKRP